MEDFKNLIKGLTNQIRRIEFNAIELRATISVCPFTYYAGIGLKRSLLADDKHAATRRKSTR